MSVLRYLRFSTHPLFKRRKFSICIERLLNYTASEYGHQQRDPAPLFFNPEVQALLKNLTRIDLKTIYRMRKLGNKYLEQPVYKFMTSEELQSLVEEANEKVNKLVQMPPVVKVCKPIHNIINKDPALQGLDTCRYVFTDVTFGIKDSDRFIVVREPDGTLQHAEWELRHRMNQLYFPKSCRSINTPRMFQDEYLEKLLNRSEYEFILDRACAQFEPFDPLYQRITSLTYEHLNSKSAFHYLRSTRHFGPLTFYLAWFKNIDNLLLELLETAHIDEANCLVELFAKLQLKHFHSSDSKIDNIKEYIINESQKKALLELALQAYFEMEKQKAEYEKGLQAAHGVSN